MADFKTHISTSTVVGIGYGALGHACGMTLATSMLAGGLCSVAGMLPDLDSDTGVPLRESIAFGAAIVPMMLIDRLQHMGLSNEAIVLAGGLIYLIVRFGVSDIFKKYTVHRGMWHSIPAAATCGLLTFLIASGPDLEVRLFKSIAVVLGFMIHLLLDELWSFERKGVGIRVKKSFGTAMKFWSRRSMWANVSTYGKLAILLGLVVGDDMLMDHFGYQEPYIPMAAKQLFDDAVQDTNIFR
jgi:membrane-bound metal-dependent hydrolase YbcI (DUF457 family)